MSLGLTLTRELKYPANKAGEFLQKIFRAILIKSPPVYGRRGLLTYRLILISSSSISSAVVMIREEAE